MIHVHGAHKHAHETRTHGHSAAEQGDTTAADCAAGSTAAAAYHQNVSTRSELEAPRKYAEKRFADHNKI